jgi:hypothetical protein
MGVGVYSHAPAALPPERTLGTHCTGSYMGPRVWTGAENLVPRGIFFLFVFCLNLFLLIFLAFAFCP